MNWRGGLRKEWVLLWLCWLSVSGTVAHFGQAAAQTASAAAGQLYAQARDFYWQGDRAAAVANLRLLIERFPAGRLARRARRDLKAIAAQAKTGAKAGRVAKGEDDSLNLLAPPRKLTRRLGPAAGGEALNRGALKPVAAPAPKLLRTGEKRGAAGTAGIVPAPKRAIRPSIRPSIRPKAPALFGKKGVASGNKIRLWDEVPDRVFFGDGVAKLGARARPVLAAQAVWLRGRPKLKVTVLGHADDSGSAGDNKRIALRRAQAVRDRLVEEGIGAARISVRAFSKDQPIALCRQAYCSAQNRRAITVISGTEGDRRGNSATAGGQLADRGAKGRKTVLRAPLAVPGR